MNELSAMQAAYEIQKSRMRIISDGIPLQLQEAADQDDVVREVTELGRRNGSPSRSAVLVMEDLAAGVTHYSLSPLGTILESGYVSASEAVARKHQVGFELQRRSQ